MNDIMETIDIYFDCIIHIVQGRGCCLKELCNDFFFFASFIPGCLFYYNILVL